MLPDEALDVAKFGDAEAVVDGEGDGPQPVFGFAIVAGDVDVERFAALVAVEVEAIRADAENRGHGRIVWEPGSGREDEFVAEGGRNRAPRFHQRLQMRFGGLLKAQDGFTAVASVRVTAGEQFAFRDEEAVLIAPDFDLGNGNDHACDSAGCRMQREGRGLPQRWF